MIEPGRQQAGESAEPCADFEGGTAPFWQVAQQVSVVVAIVVPSISGVVSDAVKTGDQVSLGGPVCRLAKAIHGRGL